MNAYTLVVRPMGRIALPKELLQLLRLKAGDKLQFSMQADGAVIVSALQKTHDASSLPKRSGPRAKKHE